MRSVSRIFQMGLILCSGAMPLMARAAQATTGSTAASAVERLSDEQRLNRTQDNERKSEDALKEVLGRLKEAKASKDVMRISCINERLTQLKGLLRVAQTARIALQEAVAKKQQATTEDEYNKAAMAHGRVVQLRAEVEQCMGQSGYGTNQTLNLEVTQPDNLWAEQFKWESWTTIQTNPPAASPTK